MTNDPRPGTTSTMPSAASTLTARLTDIPGRIRPQRVMRVSRPVQGVRAAATVHAYEQR